MIHTQHHACSAYVSDWLEAFGLDRDETREAIDRTLSDCQSIGIGSDEAADHTILALLLRADESLQLAA